MRCPSCKSDRTKVVDSRASDGGDSIRRRRECMDCGRRYTTKERFENDLRFTVTKKDGSRVPYDREKIHAGVERACWKLAVEDESITQLVDRVEEDILQNHERGVSTEQIGRYVGRHLRRLHPVAYVRFMSVHRKFATVEEFVNEIREVREQAAQDIPAQRSLFTE
jgi:transcriptional repressor NrdR